MEVSKQPVSVSGRFFFRRKDVRAHKIGDGASDGADLKATKRQKSSCPVEK
jgi:hypothetical protein